MGFDSTYTVARFIEESSFGVTPASAMQLHNVRSAPLTRPRSFGKPNVLTGDRRQFPDTILQEDGAWTLPTVMQYKNMLLMQEGLLANDISTAFSESQTDISCTSATGTYASAALADFSTLQVGDMVYVDGFTGNTGNNGWKGPVLTKATLTFTVAPAQVVADDAAGETVTVKTQRLIDGTTHKSYSGEWEQTNGTNRFRSNVGNRVREATYGWQQGGFVDESYSLEGQAPTKAAATLGTGAATAAPITGFMNCVQDFGTLWINAAAAGITVSQLQLQVMNTHARVGGLGTLGPSEIVQGKFNANLTATGIYDDSAAADALLGNIEDHDTLSVGWDILDAQGNRMFYSLPAMKANDGQPNIGETGNLVDFPIILSAHDPTKDSGYTYAGWGTDAYMMGIYFVPAA